MSKLQLLPDWPENHWQSYYEKTVEQLGQLWSLSDDATVANCGNLKLIWSQTKWNWVLESDGVEISGFLLPFKSLAVFLYLLNVAAIQPG